MIPRASSITFAVLAVLLGGVSPGYGQIAFIQANAVVPASPQSVVSLPFQVAQTAGNLNVVVIGASDGTAQIQAVTDSTGNTYTRAGAPSVHPGGYSLAIYYAAGIGAAAPGANTVTVQFTASVTFADIRIAEYSGIDPANPLDGTAAAQGSSATSDSGALTTATAAALLVAANQVETGTSSAGSGFNARVITNPNGDILQDRILTSTGTFNATAPLSSAGDWIMQMAAFRGANGGSEALFTNEIIVQNLNFVPAMVFLPDGKMYMAEIAGTIRVVQPGGIQPDPTAVNVLPNAVATGDAGLLDLTLDPNFAQNNFYYVYYAQTAGGSMRDKVSRFTATANWNGTVAGSELVLWQDDPDNSIGHHGAAIGFGPDGKLYISTGEHDNASNSQSLTSYRGKILRINPDGTIPGDNPFVDGAGGNKDEIWAYGLRNPFRFSFDEVTGQMYLGDVGGNDHSTAIEEINLIVRGANYGWPQCEGPCGVAGFTNPIYSYAHQGRDAGVMGGFVYRGTQFPATYQGNYFFADYAQNWLKRLILDPTGTAVTGVFPFLPTDGSLDSASMGDPVQLRQGPDGALYYLDLSFEESEGSFNAGSFRKVSFVGSGNQPPSVAIAAVPTSGAPPLDVNFSSDGTFDPDGDLLSYNWDFGDGATSTEANPVHTYQQSGAYLVSLSVSDGAAASFDTLTLNVGNPPAGLILTPSDGAPFRGGDAIFISGDGNDIDDGILPDSAFTWLVVFHHDGHQHPAIGPVIGVRNLTLNIPSSGHDFQGFTRYQVVLTVTDSDGLQHTSSLFIFPEKVNLFVDTAPSGLVVEVDGISKTTPFIYDTAKRFQHTFNAPNQAQGPNQYEFASWSDGGAQNHGIIVPDQDTSYTATFNLVTPPVNSGLVAAYSFGAGSGTTVADSSGNNLTGTIVGATWTAAGKYGSALSFNGANNYVDLGNPVPLQLTGSVTVEAWVRAAANPGDDGQIVAKSNHTGWQLKTSPDTGPHTFGFGVSPSSGSLTQRYSATSRSLNTWYHLAGVYNAAAGTLSTYVNGALDNGTLSGVIPATQVNQGVNVNIGRRSGGFYFNGVIDEVRVYNRSLSQAEIQTDMNTPIGGAPSDTTLPTVSMTSPSPGANVSDTVAITASASDNAAMGGVQFLLDGANLGAEVTGPGPNYTFNWNSTTASNGPHTLSARARDAANNTATSAGVNVTVSNDTTPPTGSITSPAAGANVSDTVAITASASDNVAMGGVQFLLDGANLGAEVTGPGPSYTFNWNSTTASNGPHTLSARARDAANNTTTSAGVNVNVSNGDLTPPAVSITAPAARASVNGIVTVTASASDNVAMAGVQFLLDGANLGVEVAGLRPSYTFNWNSTTASNGPHTLSARARDAANNTATSAGVNVNVSNGDFTPPAVSITAPAAGANVNATVTLTASAADNVAMAGVQFLLDGTNLGSEVTGLGPTYTFNWNSTTASNGPHTLSARARDAANNTTTSAGVNVTVSNPSPSGLVAAYSFGAGSGTTVADSSGNNLPGTIVGATWTAAGKYGSALSFNGTNNYVNLGNPVPLRLTGSVTIEAWVKAAANPGDDGQIVAKSNHTGWQLKTSPDTGPHTFGFGVSPSSGSLTQRYSATTRSLNTWYHVAGVYDAAARTLSIYVNGVLENGVLSGVIPAAQVNSGVNVNIGRRSGGFYFNGVIDEVRIYNRALSQAEIQTDMNTPIVGN